MRRNLAAVIAVLLSFGLVIGLVGTAFAQAETRSIDQELARLAADSNTGNAQRPFQCIVLGDTRAQWQLYADV